MEFTESPITCYYNSTSLQMFVAQWLWLRYRTSRKGREKNLYISPALNVFPYYFGLSFPETMSFNSCLRDIVCLSFHEMPFEYNVAVGLNHKIILGNGKQKQKKKRL